MRHIIGLLAFALAAALGVAAIRLFDPPARPAPPDVRAYNVVVRQLTLDRNARRAHVVAEVTWLGTSPAPDAVRARIVIFAPSRSAIFVCPLAELTWPSPGVAATTVRFD